MGEVGMGYFDALTSASFKTASDGSRLFVPFGVSGRGYVIASEQDYQRLRRNVKIYYSVSLALIIGINELFAFIGASGPLAYVVLAVVAVLLMGFYGVWAWSVCRPLQPSNEKLSRQERMTTMAHAHSAAFLRLVEIVSLVFVVTGIAALIFSPSLTMLAVVGFFGFCAVVFARMLRLRRGHAGGEPSAL